MFFRILKKFIRNEAEVLYGKGNNMEEYFEYLVERARYYERFEIFRKGDPKVQIGLNRREHIIAVRDQRVLRIPEPLDADLPE